MVNSVIYFCIYMCVIVYRGKLMETFKAGNTYLLLELFNTILPEINSFIIELGFGCTVCMLNPSVKVTKRSEY